MSRFEKAFAIVVGHEGGFDANPNDPGNWTSGHIGLGTLGGTKYGISSAAYPSLDVANLTLAEAQSVYRRDYWDRVDGDDLPPCLSLLVFDSAVNNGPHRAIRWVQAAAGAPTDGVMGKMTLAAIATADQSVLCAEYLALRLAFMAALPGWSMFGLGWARRLCALPFQSSLMETP